MSKHLPENHTRTVCAPFVDIPSKRSKYNLLVSCADILDGGPARANLVSQEASEYLYDVSSRLETESYDVLDEEEEEVCGVGLLGELDD